MAVRMLTPWLRAIVGPSGRDDAAMLVGLELSRASALVWPASLGEG